MFNIAKALKEEKHNFEFIALDTVTALEEIATDYAAIKYKQTNMGKNWEGSGKDILKLPNGSGYFYLREAMQEIIGWFKKVSKNLILTGHVKDKMLNEFGTELNIKALDLSGKISTILAADSDAMCYIYRDPETGKLLANFGDMNSVLCGSRLEELSGKTYVLAEKKENNEIITHWEDIYPSLRKK